MCSVSGCENKEVARGMCEKHYRRFIRHGSVENTRPKDWGSRESHPLYGSWTWQRRSKKGNLCSEWQSDFWKFVEDVGERPSENHKLQKIDDAKPLSKDNFVWVDPLLTTKSDGGRAAYAKAYRLLNPQSLKNSELKKQYGITLEDFNNMKTGQNGVCAICGKPETMVINGKVIELSVDHDHKTGKVRGLLCSHCNHAIGKLKDDVELLDKAVAYLKHHEGKK